MKSASVFRALFAAACLAMGAVAAAPAIAQQPFVIVPDNPGNSAGGSGNAVATANVNIRRGPGTNHPVVGVLQRGDSVNIERCSNGWCLIDQRGPTGWVSQNYLRRVVDTGRPGGGGGGGIGPGPSNRQACFYESPNFRGRSFCARPGESDSNLGSWNNRISSIAIRGFTTVQVCTDRRFTDCTAYNRDVRHLPRWLDQNISAFRVFH